MRRLTIEWKFVFGVALTVFGVPKAPFRPYPTDTNKPEAQVTPGLPANEPGGSRTHDLRIKSPIPAYTQSALEVA